MVGLSEGLRLVDRYVLQRPLGRGGQADIWLARDERAANSVVLKFLDSALAEDARQRELFRKEWQLGSRLMHANIARVFEYYDEERPFFALQFVGVDDVGVLANDTLADALPPMTMLADALRYTHAKDVVHRDIKASNVLLDERGVPHLVDFGVAAAPSGGTPISASPGQRSGAAAEPPDDIYAFGVLLHELIVGAPPPASGVAQPLIRQNGEPVPEAVERLLGGMLSPDAGVRPTADGVAQALTDAGFAAAPARGHRRAVSGSLQTDEPVAVTAVRPAQTVPTSQSPQRMPAASQDRAGGVSAAMVYAGLAVLLLVFAGVLFVLPEWSTPDDDAGARVSAESVAADSSATSDQSSSSVADAELSPGLDGDPASVSENLGAAGVDTSGAQKLATDEALGDLLSQLERLRYRGIERWGGQAYLDAMEIYAEGDSAYVARDYELAGERYRQTLDLLQPFFSQIEARFSDAMSAGKAAFEREDFVEAIRQYDLAVAITPSNAAAERGLQRARNLEAVLDLVTQGDRYRDELALDAAKLAYEKALEMDGEWEPAKAALIVVEAELKQFSFEARMTEGFAALSSGDFPSARAAFNAAKRIDPDSREPTDGILQLDQQVRLSRIQRMEAEALDQEDGELWEAAVATYESLLEVDADLEFAQEGLARSKARAALHGQLQGYIDAPDSLSDPTTMQQATQTLLDISRMPAVGPRLSDQKESLSRLLKRAATPLTVQLVSDNATEVSVYRVGKLGTFANRELSLRPGSYVAVGVRPGYRDVRLEFRVAPELELEPVIVRCEEPI